jgi:dUTP pyrophosphatase
MDDKQPLKIRVQRLPHGVNQPLPVRSTEGSAGFDLFAAIPEEISLNSGERAAVPCGFKIEVPAGYEAQIRPRSGLALKIGLTVVNTPGTIDSDYRGEVQAILINHGLGAVTIAPGTRIAQMIINELPAVELEESEDLSITARGECGLGSTGV